MSKIYTVAVLFLSSKHEEEAGIVAGHIKRNKVIAVSSIEKIDTSLDIDIAVIVGGDGSFVRAANKFVGKNTKFFCINKGTVGFTAHNIQSSNYGQIEHYIENSAVENLPMLKICMYNQDTKNIVYALNDFYINKNSAQAAKLQISYKNYKTNFIGDGIAVSTPMGSGAYNLSAGGPLLHFRSEDLCLTPICASMPEHWRGGVISGKSKLTIELDQDRVDSYLLNYDGMSFSSKFINKITVSKSLKNITKVMFYKHHNLESKIYNNIFK